MDKEFTEQLNQAQNEESDVDISELLEKYNREREKLREILDVKKRKHDERLQQMLLNRNRQAANEKKNPEDKEEKTDRSTDAVTQVCVHYINVNKILIMYTNMLVGSTCTHEVLFRVHCDNYYVYIMTKTHAFSYGHFIVLFAISIIQQIKHTAR